MQGRPFGPAGISGAVRLWSSAGPARGAGATGYLGKAVDGRGGDLGAEHGSPRPVVVVDLDTEGVEEAAEPVGGQFGEVDLPDG